MAEVADVAQPETAPERTSAIYTAYLNKREEIGRVLKTLRDQRAGLQLRIEGDNGVYGAKILDVGAQRFLLDDIQPRSGRSMLKVNTNFTFSARSQGLYVHSNVNIVRKLDAERGIPYFHIDLPESLLYQQRRRAARFRIPMRAVASGASVTVIREQETLTGRIIDISAGGCRAEFDGPIIPPVVNDEELTACSVSIPNLLDVTSKAAIRHSSYNRNTRTLTCGIELTEMNVTDRRRLEQFIQSINRRNDQG